MPAYKQRLKQEAFVQRKVTHWTDQYKAASYNVHRAVKAAKRRYGRKLLQQGGPRSLWQGLRNITDYKTPASRMENADVYLANEVNIFYARFEAAANHASGTNSMHPERVGEVNMFTFLEHDVRRARPDGITGRVRNACIDQLAPVFTEIFNLLLEQSVVPSCFKQSIIVPVLKKPHPACLNDYAL